VFYAAEFESGEGFLKHFAIADFDGSRDYRIVFWQTIQRQSPYRHTPDLGLRSVAAVPHRASGTGATSKYIKETFAGLSNSAIGTPALVTQRWR